MAEIKKPTRELGECCCCERFDFLNLMHETLPLFGRGNPLLSCDECFHEQIGEQLHQCHECEAVHYYQEAPNPEQDWLETLKWPAARHFCVPCRTRYMQNNEPLYIRKCEVCSDIYATEQQNPEPLCGGCREFHSKCDVCHERWVHKSRAKTYHHDDRGIPTSLPNTICEECRPLQHQQYCASCNRWFEARELFKEGLCVSCFVNCTNFIKIFYCR